MKGRTLVGVAIAAVLPFFGVAETYTLAGKDAASASAMNGAGSVGWTDSSGVTTKNHKPSAGNDYVVDQPYCLRTPTTTAFTFAGDSLTLTVKAKASGDSPVLLSLSSTTNEIVIPSASTAAMKIGQYSADIELRLAAGQRITVWPLLIGKARTQECNYRNFTLMPEVTGV